MILLIQPVVHEDVHVSEICELVELGDRVDFAFDEDTFALAQRDIREIGQAVPVAAAQADHGDVEARTECGMTDEFANQRRGIGYRDLGVGNFRGDHRLEYRRLALDDEIAPAPQLAKLVDAALDENTVATAQNGLPAGQWFTAPLAHQRKDDQARRCTDAAFGKCFADQNRVCRYTHHECALVQLVLGPQAALTDVLAVFGHVLG